MSWPMLISVIVSVVVGAFIMIAKDVLRQRSLDGSADEGEEPLLPYVLRSHLLTPAELAFYRALRLALPADLQILVKPRLADLLEVIPDLPAAVSRRAFNRISQKHADFVICDLDCAPELVIELDDASHRQASRAKRDILVDRIYQAVALPVVHHHAQESYAVSDLRTIVARLRKTRMAAVPLARKHSSEIPG